MGEQNSDDEDAGLFQQTLKGVRPLTDDNRHHQRPVAKIRKPARHRPADPLYEAFLETTADTQEDIQAPGLLYQRPGLQHREMRRLRRGQISREDELDLHGLTVEQAARQVAEFLTECQANGLRCVSIIHGKGLRSGTQGPVLKSSLGQWLQRYEEVLAVSPAQPRDGGSGAVYVLLRRASAEG